MNAPYVVMKYAPNAWSTARPLTPEVRRHAVSAFTDSHITADPYGWSKLLRIEFTPREIPASPFYHFSDT